MARPKLPESPNTDEEDRADLSSNRGGSGIDRSDRASYAINVADESYSWYRRAAIRSRRIYRGVEVAQLLTAALIPLSPVLLEGNTVVPAALGACVVALTGLRSIFHWQENYLRFSQAREAVDAERRAYFTGAAPYSNANTRDQRLVSAVTAIEQREMGGWLEIAGQRRGQSHEVSATETGSLNEVKN